MQEHHPRKVYSSPPLIILKIIGPSAPVIAKIRDIYRRVVYIKNYRYNELVVLKDQIEQYISEKKEVQDLSLQFDFNPLNMY